MSAVGTLDSIARTTDGGTTWQNVTPPIFDFPDSIEIAVVTFVSADTAWITYLPDDFIKVPEPHIVWVTRNGGSTWQQSSPIQFSDVGEFYAVDPIVVASENVVYMLIHVGAGMHHDYAAMLKSINGGMKWDVLFSPIDNFDAVESYSKTGLAFYDEKTGWMTFDAGGVTDGIFLNITKIGGRGKWESISISAPDDFLSNPQAGPCGLYDPYLFSLTNRMLGMVCKIYGDKTIYKNYFYSTDDGGTTWTYHDLPGNELYMLDEDTGFASGEGLYFTHDAGETWGKINETSFKQLNFVDQDLGWGICLEHERFLVFRTTDGGRTWCEISIDAAIGG